MTTIKDIFTDFGPEYLKRFEDTIPSEHKKVMDAIIHCKTDFYGASIYQCEKCRKKHIVHCACGNRHCPNCQHHKTHKWLETQIQRQLPGHHFMLTFTVPEDIRRFIRRNQRICYSAMFKASSDAIKKLAADEKYIGGDLPGFFGVLHTWGRQLPYHPHIHYLVPGGAISRADGRWHPSRLDFFLPVKAMSKIFKAKFRDIMKKSGLYPKIPDEVWDKAWVINCQAVFNRHNTINYLARYVFKVAISNSRIVKVEDRKVFFKYRKTNSNRWRTMALDVMEFLRRFLQHVLPSGFMKVRYYGFLNPNCSIRMEKIAVLIYLAFGFELSEPITGIAPLKLPTCIHCGSNLKYVTSVRNHSTVLAGAG